MPRDPLIQAALAAVAASLGYEAAMLVRALWRYMEIPDIKGRFLWVWWATALLMSIGILVYSLSKAASWQNATRAAVDLPPLDTAAPFFILPLAG